MRRSLIPGLDSHFWRPDDNLFFYCRFISQAFHSLTHLWCRWQRQHGAKDVVSTLGGANIHTTTYSWNQAIGNANAMSNGSGGVLIYAVDCWPQFDTNPFFSDGTEEDCCLVFTCSQTPKVHLASFHVIFAGVKTCYCFRPPKLVWTVHQCVWKTANRLMLILRHRWNKPSVSDIGWSQFFKEERKENWWGIILIFSDTTKLIAQRG